MFHLMRQAYVLGNRGRRLGIYSCLNRYVTVSAKARNGLHGSMLARATTAVIGVFMQNDTIDLQHVAYNAGDKVQLLAGNVLEVDNAGGAALADISLPTTMGYSADQFVLSPSDGLDIAVNTVTVVAAAAANASIHLDALNADFATHRDRIDRSRRVASVTVTDNSPVSTTIVQFGGDAARLRRND